MLALIAISALICATLLPPLVERSRAARLSGTGIQILTEARGQFFLRQIAGDAFSERVVYVHLDNSTIDDAWLEKLSQFPYIEVVSIKSMNVTDRGLKYLERLPNLTSLVLIDTQATTEGIARLRDSAPSIRYIDAYSSQQ